MRVKRRRDSTEPEVMCESQVLERDKKKRQELHCE